MAHEAGSAFRVREPPSRGLSLVTVTSDCPFRLAVRPLRARIRNLLRLAAGLVRPA